MTRDGFAIDVDSLSVVRSGRLVLDHIHFKVPKGQLVGLLGPSGSGKSTLMRSLLGLQVIEHGIIEVLGLPAGAPTLRRRVGYVSQALSVYVDLTVIENLRYFASVLEVPRGDVDRVLHEVGLERYSKSLVGRLSGGEQARVSLATALLGTPELLILDEPTVGLDPLLRRDLWATFARLAQSGTSLLVSSHVMDEAARCDRLLLLRGGRILADQSPSQLLASTGTDSYDQAFVSIIERAQ